MPNEFVVFRDSDAMKSNTLPVTQLRGRERESNSHEACDQVIYTLSVKWRHCIARHESKIRLVTVSSEERFYTEQHSAD